MMLCEFGKPLPAGRVPAIVKVCTENLVARGLNEEGLLRVSGSTEEVAAMKAAFAAASDEDEEEAAKKKKGSGRLRGRKAAKAVNPRELVERSSVHSVGSLLKSYLRSLPEPLLTHERYDRWREAMKADDIPAAKALVDALPPVNRATLAVVVRFLAQLAANSDTNKMTVRNIAIVMGPNLMWPPGSFGSQLVAATPRTAMLETTETSGVAALLVENCEALFLEPPPQDSQEKKASDAETRSPNEEEGADGSGSKSKKKSKTKKKEEPAPAPAAAASASATDSTESSTPKKKRPPQAPGQMFCVHVGRSMALKPGKNYLHPMVCIHVVDKASGRYVRTTGDEPEPLLPILTQPVTCSDSTKPFAPAWNEDVAFPEEFDSVVTESTVVLFEILDFGVFSISKGVQKGFLPVAWAFLSPISQSGDDNTGREIRLQLYEFTKTRNPSALFRQDVPDVYFSWRKNKKLYPSSLFVSIFPQKPPSEQELVPMARPMTFGHTQLITKTFKELQEERGIVEDDEGSPASQRKRQPQEGGEGKEKETPPAVHPVRWERKPGEECHVPSFISARIDTQAGGCSALAFSLDGLFLAAACSDKLLFSIQLLKVPTWDHFRTHAGHHAIVYELAWTADGSHVISASADCTAKLWALDDGSFVTLQHPCIVYTARPHPRKFGGSEVVLTGALDGLIRIWSIDGARRATMEESLQGHSSNVNAIAFAENGAKLISGDGRGEVRVWLVGASEEQCSFSCFQTLSNFGGSAINALSIHPTKRRFFVHSRNSTITEVDIRLYSNVRTFFGHQNTLWQLKPALSPDGRFLVSGSENERLYVWTADDGAVARVFEEVGLKAAPAQVVWHPIENMLVVGALGSDYPLVVYTWDRRLDSASVTQTQGEGGVGAEADDGTEEVLPGALEFDDQSSARASSFRRAFESVLGEPSPMAPVEEESVPIEPTSSLPPLRAPTQRSGSPQPLASARTAQPQPVSAAAKSSSVSSLPPITLGQRQQQQSLSPDGLPFISEADKGRKLERLVRQRRRESELARTLAMAEQQAAFQQREAAAEVEGEEEEQKRQHDVDAVAPSPLPSSRFNLTTAAVASREALLNTTFANATQ